MCLPYTMARSKSFWFGSLLVLTKCIWNEKQLGIECVHGEFGWLAFAGNTVIRSVRTHLAVETFLTPAANNDHFLPVINNIMSLSWRFK